ncbi:MAG: amino acid transporter permease [Microbacteriaceae bacterium]|jgi:polar amino acid transport system permease protein|nr:amino acid transporter permease [Microbacteriaceae bacterium]
MIEWLPPLLSGLLLSLQITAISLAIGLPLGLLFAVLVQSQSRIVRWVTVGVVEIGRGAPALVVLQFVYYGLPSAGITLDDIPSAWIALSFTTASFTSEIMRGGLEAVARGQHEASSALGFARGDAFRFVVLPQAMRVALPGLLGFAIQIFQATSLTFTIAVPELLSRAYSIGASSFRYVEVLLLAGLLYAVIAVPASRLVARLERRLSRHLA